MKIGSNSHYLLDNCEMIDGQSSGDNERERIFDKKAIINPYGKWGRLNRFNVPVLKFCIKMDRVLSVCLNQQSQLDELVVAACVSKILTEDKFCQSLPVVSRAL